MQFYKNDAEIDVKPENLVGNQELLGESEEMNEHSKTIEPKTKNTSNHTYIGSCSHWSYNIQFKRITYFVPCVRLSC